jgi:hypothetical protein
MDVVSSSYHQMAGYNDYFNLMSREGQHKKGLRNPRIMVGTLPCGKVRKQVTCKYFRQLLSPLSPDGHGTTIC